MMPIFSVFSSFFFFCFLQIRDRIVHSIAPAIFGHDHVKTAVTLSLFGGCSKNPTAGGTRTRGDINVLVLGESPSLR
jgi:DNA replication licensing factor MCM2